MPIALKPRKKPLQARSTVTVDAIVEATIRILRRDGWAACTTTRISTLAGVSVGSLYQYFPHKDALLVGLAHRHVDSVVAAVDAFTASMSSDTVELDAVLADLASVLVAQHELDHLHTIIAHQAPRTADLERELARARERFIDMADDVLVPRIPDPSSRRAAAAMVVAILDAAVHQVLLLQSPGPQRDHAVELMLAAVAAVIACAASTAGA